MTFITMVGYAVNLLIGYFRINKGVSAFWGWVFGLRLVNAAFKHELEMVRRENMISPERFR